MEFRLELVQIPVADVERAKAFYVEQVGFTVDHDHQLDEALRFVQLTPPGSACSIALTAGAPQAAPGSLQGLQVTVADAEAVREQLLARNVEVSEVHDFPWGRFVYFADPDGNSWAVQQIPERG